MPLVSEYLVEVVPGNGDATWCAHLTLLDTAEARRLALQYSRKYHGTVTVFNQGGVVVSRYNSSGFDLARPFSARVWDFLLRFWEEHRK